MKISSFFKKAEPKKKCFRCGEKKLHRFFQKDSQTKDGLRSSCTECSNEGRRTKPEKKTGDQIKGGMGTTIIPTKKTWSKKTIKLPEDASLPAETINIGGICGDFDPNQSNPMFADSSSYAPKDPIADSHTPIESDATKRDAQRMHSIFQKPQEKHQAPICVTFYRTGKYRIQTHGSITRHTWTGCIEDILPKAMRG